MAEDIFINTDFPASRIFKALRDAQAGAFIFEVKINNETDCRVPCWVFSANAHT